MSTQPDETHHPSHAPQAEQGAVPYVQPEQAGPEEQREQPAERPTNSIRALIEEATGRILDGINAADTTELERYLTVAARFPGLSLYNQHLLYLQYPQASYICRWETWREFHYGIRRGEKAIHLVERDLPITVFDRAQMEPREGALDTAALLPEPPALYDVYLRLLDALTVRDLDWSQDGERLVLPAEAEPKHLAAELAYLVAGYADHLLHTQPFGRVAETRFWDCHVEAVTFAVLAHLGVPIELPGSDLVRWGNTPSLLREELEAVRRSTQLILKAIIPPEYARRTPAEPIQQRHYPL